MRFVLGAILLATFTVAAQTPALQFEVASIKPSHADAHPPRWQDAISIGGVNDNRDFDMIDGTVGALILYAFPVQTEELLRAPEWVRTDRYEIHARGSQPVAREQREQMVKALLRERFQMTAHYETVTRPVFELVRARTDRPLPSTLTAVSDCADVRTTQDQGPPVAPGTLRQCRHVFGSGSFVSTGTTLGNLATALSRYVGRLVLDKTDSTEDFAFDLTWDPRVEAIGIDRPTLGQALDGIGLKLQTAEASIPVLVIDHIERPSEN